MDSLQTRTPFNEGNYPVVDRNGKPFTPGCRIKFRVPAYYINTTAGTGTITKIDQYGGCYFMSDVPMAVYDRNGCIVERRRDQYTPISEYQTSGPHKGKLVTGRGLGDPFERGVTPCFIEVA